MVSISYFTLLLSSPTPHSYHQHQKDDASPGEHIRSDSATQPAAPPENVTVGLRRAEDEHPTIRGRMEQLQLEAPQFGNKRERTATTSSQKEVHIHFGITSVICYSVIIDIRVHDSNIYGVIKVQQQH